jgi:hypothetical protein
VFTLATAISFARALAVWPRAGQCGEVAVLQRSPALNSGAILQALLLGEARREANHALPGRGSMWMQLLGAPPAFSWQHAWLHGADCCVVQASRRGAGMVRCCWDQGSPPDCSQNCQQTCTTSLLLPLIARGCPAREGFVVTLQGQSCFMPGPTGAVMSPSTRRHCEPAWLVCPWAWKCPFKAAFFQLVNQHLCRTATTPAGTRTPGEGWGIGSPSTPLSMLAWQSESSSQWLCPVALPPSFASCLLSPPGSATAWLQGTGLSLDQEERQPQLL